MNKPSLLHLGITVAMEMNSSRTGDDTEQPHNMRSAKLRKKNDLRQFVLEFKMKSADNLEQMIEI